VSLVAGFLLPPSTEANTLCICSFSSS